MGKTFELFLCSKNSHHLDQVKVWLSTPLFFFFFFWSSSVMIPAGGFIITSPFLLTILMPPRCMPLRIRNDGKGVSTPQPHPSMHTLITQTGGALDPPQWMTSV